MKSIQIVHIREWHIMKLLNNKAACSIAIDCSKITHIQGLKNRSSGETKICQMCMCTCLMSKPIKKKFGHHSHFVTYFSFESLPGHSNPEFYDRVCDIAVSMCFGYLSHLLTYFSWKSLPAHLNLAIRFVLVRNCICSHTYGIMLVHLNVFHFLSVSDNTYRIYGIKTTHYLFKWCRRLKAVLGNLTFY